MMIQRLLQIEAKQLKKNENKTHITEEILKSKIIAHLYGCDFKQ